jgi:hypothetical protein
MARRGIDSVWIDRVHVDSVRIEKCGIARGGIDSVWIDRVHVDSVRIEKCGIARGGIERHVNERVDRRRRERGAG